MAINALSPTTTTDSAPDGANAAAPGVGAAASPHTPAASGPDAGALAKLEERNTYLESELKKVIAQRDKRTATVAQAEAGAREASRGSESGDDPVAKVRAELADLKASIAKSAEDALAQQRRAAWAAAGGHDADDAVRCAEIFADASGKPLSTEEGLAAARKRWPWRFDPARSSPGGAAGGQRATENDLWAQYHALQSSGKRMAASQLYRANKLAMDRAALDGSSH